MDALQYNQIMDFAIEKEQEAIEFYEILKLRTEFKFMHDSLNQLISMEQGHIIRLQQIRTIDINEINISNVEPLKLSDYYEELINYEALDYPKLLLIAMKREEKAKNLYTDLSYHVSDKELKKTFTLLANEEETHKIQFEKIYDDEVLKNN